MKLGIKLGLVAGLMACHLVSFAQDQIRVTYAGSMGVVMDKALGPDFAKKLIANIRDKGKVLMVWHVY